MSRRESYKIQLNDLRWSRRRKEIMSRDGYRCRRCGASGNLNVHHLRYRRGRAPWQYPDSYLVTLCEKCHHRIHLMRTIRSLVGLALFLAGAYVLRMFFI